jgi:hypothetical protein
MSFLLLIIKKLFSANQNYTEIPPYLLSDWLSIRKHETNADDGGVALIH